MSPQGAYVQTIVSWENVHIVAIHSCKVLPTSAEGTYNTVLDDWEFPPQLQVIHQQVEQFNALRKPNHHIEPCNLIFHEWNCPYHDWWIRNT